MSAGAVALATELRANNPAVKPVNMDSNTVAPITRRRVRGALRCEQMTTLSIVSSSLRFNSSSVSVLADASTCPYIVSKGPLKTEENKVKSQYENRNVR